MNCLDGKWQRPVSVGAAAEIEAMVSMGVAAWCAAGTDPDGRGFLLGYRALRGTAERYSIASSPLHAVATDAEGTIFAVGSGGYVFRMPRGRPPALERAMTQRDLAVIATDPRGDVWAAGPGRVLRRPAREDDHTWTAVWVDANTAAPFLAIEAMIGLIIAVGVDGSVLCGRERQDQAANA